MPVTPLQAATDVLDRADALLALDAPPTLEDVRTDLRRLAWAMASASIDTFLHWRVARADLYAPQLRQELRELTVPFGELVAMARADVIARQENRVNRPVVKARNVLHERILRDTFQNKRGVERALSMCGVADIWRRISAAMGETVGEVTDHVNALANRRNAIVHEGDIQRQSRPQQVRHQPISEAEIRAELDWARRFVNALALVAP